MVLNPQKGGIIMAMEKIGALWLKDGKSGKFMSGVIGGKNVLIFKNTRKQA